GVDMSFSSDELTLDLDDFSKRILDPAISVLAAAMEADAYSMYKDVYNTVDSDAAALTFKNIMQGRQKLNDNLAPEDNNRTAMLSTGHQVTIVDALKGLFHDDKAVTKQYREGMMGRTAGFDWYENTHVLDHTTGTAAKATVYVMDGIGTDGAALTVDTGSTTFLVGDVITIADVNRVHPETKTDTGILQQFVITANSGASATELAISPSIVSTGARQNVSNVPGDGKAIVKVGAGANETMNSSMVYHKDAFTIATADLVKPKGVDFCAREVFDGISMRIVRAYDINNDLFPCRIDILYGYKTIRAQTACRIHADA
ncbi:MAG: P22 phage major capsid protein family protein, partial [Alphaproteobacteria bacterium]